ncbi:MAG: SPW repeat protein [Burkholderiaceae bacterium]|nr:SPW repeat protein [Burkholderiaceae bacterium]
MATTRWQDWIKLLLGLWLVASPWVLGYTLYHTATANACAVGAALTLSNFMGVAKLNAPGQEVFKETGHIALAGWLIISPYALDFASLQNVTGNAVATGAATLVLAAWQLLDALLAKTSG